MHYYQVRIRALSTGRYLNVPSSTAGHTWLENRNAVPAELQTYHLRKIDEKRFILENGGSWVGLETGYDEVTKYLNMRFKSAGKEQAFEITPQPYLLERVRIKSLANGLFAQLRKGSPELSNIPVNFTPTARLDDAGVFVMEPTETKLEIANQGINSNPGTIVSVPAVLDNIIPLDGNIVQFQSVYLKQYLCVENGGGTHVAASRNTPEDKNWETFELWTIPGTRRYLFQVSGGKFMGLDDKLLVALSDTPGKVETFEIVQKDDDFTRVRIKAWDDKFLQAKGKDSVTADAAESTPNAKEWNEWRNDDPTIFLLTIVRATIPNGRTIKAIEGAAQRFKEHPPRPPTPPTPPVPQKPDIIPSSPSPKDLSNRGFLHYYDVRIKALSTGRYLNLDSHLVNGPWVRSQNGVPAANQTFHLRKIYEKRFILEIHGSWVGLEIGDDQGTMFLSIGFKSAGKEQAFEITPQPYLSDRVRIKSLANQLFAQHPKGYSEYHGIPVNFTPTARLDDDGVFVMEPTESKLEITNQGNNRDQGTVVSIPATLDNIRPLDGTKVQFHSVYLKQYLCAENGGGTLVAANRDMPEEKNWETFELWAILDTRKCLLQVSSGKFMGLDGKRLVALSDTPGKVETFEIVQKDDDFTRVRIKAWDGKFLQAKKKDSVTADAAELTPEQEKWIEWNDYDPTIFLLTIVHATIPNSGTIKAIEGASQKLKEHPPHPSTPPTPPVPQKPDIIPSSPLPKDLSNRRFLDGIRLQFKSVMQHIKLLLAFGARIVTWIKNLAPDMHYQG